MRCHYPDPLNQDLYPSTRLFLCEQSRRNHPRVEHQQVIGREQSREIPESQVRTDPSICLNRKKAGGGSLGQQLLRNQFRGQRKSEVSGLH